MEFQAIHKLLRTGQLAQAQQAIRMVKIRRLTRASRLRLAFLAREARLPQKAIEALSPVVRRAGRQASLATGEEKVEFAMALTAIGLTEEARDLLKNIDLTRFPLAADALATACFREWDWVGAFSMVERMYLSALGMRKSERLRMEVNYAVTLIYAKHDYAGARKVLALILARTREREFYILRHDVFLIQASTFYFQKNWFECEKSLTKARAVFGNQSSPYLRALYSMWQGLFTLARNTEAGKSVTQPLKLLAQTKEHFLNIGRFSFARFCDLDRAVCLRESTTLLRLYFATPQLAGRKRIASQLEQLKIEIPLTLDIPLRPGYANAGVVLEPAAEIQCQVRGVRALRLKTGQLPFRLLMALTSDLYVRPNFAQLFKAAYPQEYYDPGSSDARIGNGLLRLRQAIAAARVPVIIREQDGNYWVEATAALTLRLPRPPDDSNAHRFPWHRRVQEQFGAGLFASGEFAARFKLSERAAQYRLKTACAQGWLVCLGRGPATRYQLANGPGVSSPRQT